MFSMRFNLFVILSFSVVIGISTEQYKIVETQNGPVRGVLETTILKKVSYYSFKGIPFAKPPIGDLRLKAPEQVESWNNVLDAFEYGKICIQPGKLFPEPYLQSEDCLKLNIFIPADVKPNESLAVLFFIYGGGYAEGSSNDYIYGPDFIVEQQTILVTINYRLGLLGFLSLDTPEHSGNMGLKDQQLALKWIHSNIDRFGGDSKRITIFGESAGGASVHFHILSAESRKYFRNAIPMSGVIDNYWAMSEKNDHVELAYKIAKDFGEPKDTYDELVNFLMSAPADKLSEYSLLVVPNILFEIAFTPVIERRDAKQSFIVESPEKIYETTDIDVDTMFSMTSLETVGYISMFPPLNDLLANFDVPLPFRGLKIPLDSNEHGHLVDEIRNFYFGDNVKSAQVVKKYVELLSDVNFGYGIYKAVRTFASKSTGKTYYYWFSVDSKLSTFIPRSADVANITGASHGDDLFYLFRCEMARTLYDEIVNSKDDEKSKVSIRAIESISKIVTNFAKYGEPSHEGDPVDEFQPVRNEKIQVIDINNEGVTIKSRPNQKAFDFWATIEKKAVKLSELILKQNKDEL
ncbi:esterase B1-like [Sitodiplosis mosellana]|uniref:esterase B1-like n=1 Tax=Sitodiplosis mosellana TaxID=263140 RepID=UPI0024438FDF|nr:esterase B1-like [Sitodiplosis mosellana]